MSDDPYDLARFVAAQESSFDSALAEIRAGRKTSHWMWYVFPQIRGLGRSGTAVFYAIASLDEARAYLAHDVLGPRLDAITRAALRHDGKTPHAIFGSPDDMKFHSSMTLFSVAGPGVPFTRALEVFFDGAPDRATLRILGSA